MRILQTVFIIIIFTFGYYALLQFNQRTRNNILQYIVGRRKDRKKKEKKYFKFCFFLSLFFFLHNKNQ